MVISMFCFQISSQRHAILIHLCGFPKNLLENAKTLLYNSLRQISSASSTSAVKMATLFSVLTPRRLHMSECRRRHNPEHGLQLPFQFTIRNMLSHPTQKGGGLLY